MQQVCAWHQQARIACINPDELEQQRDVKDLKKKYQGTHKTIMLMLEADKKSRMSMHTPWADPAIKDFFEMSGGWTKH